jgi:hypothetical protein
MWLRQPPLQRIALLNQVQLEDNLHFDVGTKISTCLYFLLTSYLIKHMDSFLHIVYFSFLSLQWEVSIPLPPLFGWTAQRFIIHTYYHVCDSF